VIDLARVLFAGGEPHPSDFARTGRFIGVSGAGVFFFGCLYLQHVMNEAAATPARSAPTPP
jgi:hypothetical protein